MRFFIYIASAFIFSSCGKIPAPSIILPSENEDLRKVSIGDPPQNYQKILKDYLINNLANYKNAKVEFINEPAKLSINHLRNTYSGYRVCLSINEKKGEFYSGYKNHFFLINNNKVDLHLFDSGLLTIPFQYCVTRNKSRELFVEDIPDRDINVDSMDNAKLTSKENLKYKELETELKNLKKENSELKRRDISESKNIDNMAKVESVEKVYSKDNNIYILCTFDDKDMTFIFNDSKETFRFIDKLNIDSYVLSFNEAYIVASKEDIELTINRVSGSARISSIGKGQCKLTDRTKF
tara:strand:+ start:47 stop:931 length:885 start_codon:yes stop_codon:yes gene_type:complete